MPARHAAPRPVGIPLAERNAVTALHLEHSPGMVPNFVSYVAETFQRKIEYVSSDSTLSHRSISNNKSIVHTINICLIT